MGELRLVARGVFAQWVSLITRAFLAIVLVPVVIRELGSDSYGIVTLVTIIVGLSHLADFGFGQALSRELAEHHARGDREAQAIVTSTGLFFYSALALVLSAGICSFGAPLLLALGVDSANSPVGLRLLYWYAVPSLVLSLLTPPFAANLISRNRFDILRTIELLGTLANGIGILLLLPRAADKISAWIAVTMFARIATFMATAVAARRCCGSLGIRPGAVRRSSFGPIFRLGGHMYVMQLASMLTDKSDPVILSHFRGEGSLTVYQPATQVSVMLRPLVGSLANQLHPSTTRSHVTGDSARMRELLFLGTRYTLLVGIGACVIAFTLSSGFCRLWLGRVPGTDWITSSWVMKGWLVADLCQYLGGVQWAVLVGMKRLRVMVSGMLAASVVNVAATFFLMRYSGLGIAWVTVPTIVVTLALRPCLAVYASRLCGVTLRAYWQRAYSRPLLIGLLLSVACWLLTVALPSSSLAGLAVSAVLAGVAWAALVWAVGLSAGERRLVSARLFKHLRVAG